jgi:hypothetical protein
MKFFGRRHEMLIGKVSRPRLMTLACIFLELPGIEPVAQIVLNCENVEFDDAKAHENTRKYLWERPGR